MTHINCAVCDGGLVGGDNDWHLFCKVCSYETGQLEILINDEDAHERVKEVERENGLRVVRARNFDLIAKVLLEHSATGEKVLDVGCAHGWFLEAARSKGLPVMGMEPENHLRSVAISKGFEVIPGLFPDNLPSDQTFGGVVFNDVFEHIPDVQSTIKACFSIMSPGGVLIINLPNSSGIIYRCSVLLRKLGFPAIFDRMWQRGFPSPHVHYFNGRNIGRLLKQNGFIVVETGRLETISFRGLRDRLSYDKHASGIFFFLSWVVTCLLLPILRFLPPDIIYVVAKKRCVNR